MREVDTEYALLRQGWPQTQQIMILLSLSK